MTDYLKPKFTLPAGPAANVPWPFKTPAPRFCERCGYNLAFCECPPEKGDA